MAVKSVRKIKKQGLPGGIALYFPHKMKTNIFTRLAGVAIVAAAVALTGIAVGCSNTGTGHDSKKDDDPVIRENSVGKTENCQLIITANNASLNRNALTGE